MIWLYQCQWHWCQLLCMLVTSCNPLMAKLPRRSIKQAQPQHDPWSLYISNFKLTSIYYTTVLIIGHVEQTSPSYNATLKFVVWENRATFQALSKSTLVYENLFFPHHLPMLSSCDAKCSFHGSLPRFDCNLIVLIFINSSIVSHACSLFIF